MIRSHLRTQQRGQSIVMFAAMLTAFLALLSLGIDAVSLYGERRRAQAVADMAAIGGAVELDGTGGGATNARTIAQNIITANGYAIGTGSGQATVCRNTDYPTVQCPTEGTGGSGALEVTITYHAPTMFASTMGHTTADVFGRAVATRRGINEYAVYANSSSCSNPDGIKALGSGGTINGRVHSNSELNLGSNWTLNGSVTYNASAGCTISNSSSATPSSVGPQSWPLSSTVRDITQYPCNWSNAGAVTGTVYANQTGIPTGTFQLADPGAWWVNPTTKTQLKDGVYCVRDGDLKATGLSNVTGNHVTFVAAGSSGTISVNANGFTLHPYKNNILMFDQDSTSATALDVGGSGGSWEGWIYARVGGLKMTGGGGLTLTGGLFGDTVNLVGSGWSLLGTGPNSGFAGKLAE